MPFEHASDRELSIHQLLKQRVEEAADAVAIDSPGRQSLTYRGLLEQVDYVAQWLGASGITRNDRVAIIVPNGAEMAVAFLGVSAVATCAPLNPGYRQSEFDFYLSDLKAKALIVQFGVDSAAIAVAQRQNIPIIELSPASAAGTFSLSGLQQKAGDPPRLTHATDIALMLHTSGTTARPKRVPLTHANLLISARNIAETLQLTVGDRCLNVMPLFHIHGIVGALLSSLWAGSSVVCTGGFDEQQFLSWLENYRASWYTAVPTIHLAILSSVRANPDRPRSSSLRFIRSSSAPLAPKVMRELEQVFDVPVLEAYGMTEASHQICSNPLPPRQCKEGSVGLAAGPEVSIMDGRGHLLSPGEVGEVVIRGANIMSGYAGNRGANEDSFSDGWFRTGDQGYLDDDGFLFIIGRLREIINRGGEKISPAEVDEVLKEHPAVLEAVTFAVPHSTLGQDIAAAIVPREKAAVTGAEVQRFAGARLAEFKVPRQVFIVNSIPKGATGKIQRMGLAEKLGLVAASASLKTDSTAPRTPAEETLAKIWSSVLGIDLGIHDNFFYLGGDSIHAGRIISRIRASLGTELPFSAFFETPTVAAMAGVIGTAGQEVRGLKTLPVSKDGTGLLSYGQEALWFLDQLEPGNPAYNRPLFVRLLGNLNLRALERSLNEIVHRHAVLRASFPADDGQPVQRISGGQPFSLPVTDLSSLPAAEREAQARKVATEEARRAFDLARGPLLRTSLLRLEEQLHLLLVTIHHIVFDGWSAEIFLRELMMLYEAFSTGRPSPLPELSIQYLDFARWQRESAEDESVQNHLRYWRSQLDSGWPTLNLPTDRPRPRIQTFNGGNRFLMLPKDLLETLKVLSRQEGVTLFMTLLAAFKTLLHRYSGQQDIVVGTPFAGRNQVEKEDLLGLFINTLPLRTDLSDNPTFRELLARVRRTSLEAHTHQDIPFETIVAKLRLKRYSSRVPLYQFLFQLRNYPQHVGQVGDLLIEEYKTEAGTSLCDISLAIREEKEGLECRFSYNSDLFEAVTIARLANQFQKLLESIVVDSTRSLAELPLATDSEKHQRLAQWNNTREHYPKDACLHQLFESQAERTPDSIAVVFENNRLTYRELNRRANQLAHHLRSLGVGPEVLVGICLERSLELVVGLLAILKAGGAYVPLDPDYPNERLAFMLQDTHAAVLLTQQRLREALPEHGARVICVDTGWDFIARESEENPRGMATAENLAYVIYTSGSTGRPKGVMIEHKSLANYLCWFNESPLAQKPQILPVITKPTFDASLKQLFAPLLRGSQVWILSDEVVNQPALLLKTLTTRALVALNCVPSLWKAMLDAIDLDRTTASTETPSFLFLGGEQLNKPLVNRTFATLPHIEIWNLYGPTEVTANATVGRISSDGSVTLGCPIANTQIYILDTSLQPVATGVPGELYIGGSGLARGYLYRPDLTTEAFIPDPFSRYPGARLYRTGDLARYLPDGNIEFLGRIDHQVKIRGFRVELGEVEAVLRQDPAVRDVVVLAREETPTDKRLVAYIVSSQAAAHAASDLREFLKERLPDYMVPSAFVFLDALPLSSNGKVDRNALPVPDRSRPDLKAAFVAPDTATKKTIADIWAEVLKLEQIGIHDNFFDLGGHSLLLVQVHKRLREVFERDLSLIDMFEHPTVDSLARYLSQEKSELSSFVKTHGEIEKIRQDKIRLRQQMQQRAAKKRKNEGRVE